MTYADNSLTCDSEGNCMLKDNLAMLGASSNTWAPKARLADDDVVDELISDRAVKAFSIGSMLLIPAEFAGAIVAKTIQDKKRGLTDDDDLVDELASHYGEKGGLAAHKKNNTADVKARRAQGLKPSIVRSRRLADDDLVDDLAGCKTYPAGHRRQYLCIEGSDDLVDDLARPPMGGDKFRRR